MKTPFFRAKLMDAWERSPAHAANMLGDHRRVGLCRSGGYWGQLFGR